ncbi:MAG TPA: phage tail tape measure protein, partial [Bacillota bacterium]|nr:phage tail tape measure protein [Bacillota bacterium]
MAHVIDAVIQLRDEFSATIENASNKLAESHKQMLRTGRQIERTGRDLMRTGSNLTKSLTLPLIAVGTAAVKTSIDMEDAFSGVKKTISGTPEQLAAIKNELDTMATQSIPVARKELYGIAETAGQLGVAREHITDFTETIAKIGRVTNLSYEEGSASLARFANIMGMPMTEMERLGSTIVKLDTSLATSANEIV